MKPGVANAAWGRITLYFMGAALLASAVAIWSGMQGTIAASNFMPHGVCYVWNPSLIGLHLVSDTLIGIAYFSIPITLVYFIRKRRDLPFNWIFLLFGLFIVACGATHWMEVWTLWEPRYWLAGVVKAITAAASVPTAIALVMLVPQALAIPSTGELAAAKVALEAEVAERRRIEAELREAKATLEARVEERMSKYEAVANESRHMHDELAQVDARKDRFLAILSHELRNPLNPIRSAVAIMRQPNAGEEQTKFARDVIDRQVAHLSRLLDDLLDISRIKQNRVSFVRERIDVGTAINGALETTRPLIDAARQQIDVTLAPEPAMVDADPTRFAQILSNLISNASKYTDAGGKISVSVASEGAHAVVRVRDNGIGIEAQHHAGLFELFSQVDSARNRAAGGLGIGLALVKSLAEMHGGSVTVASEGLGRGSEFTVRLPLARDAVPVPHRRTTDTRMAIATESLRVLVVDDNVDSVETLAALLKMIGHEVRTANDAAGALAVAASFQPQVGILDIGLPGTDGYELAQQLRKAESGARMRLIALTGWGKDEDKQLAAQAGFDHHLTKPVDLRALEGELAKV